MSITRLSEASLGEHPGGEVGQLMDLSGYIALAVGYLLGVLAARHLTLPGLVLLTATNGVLLWLFHRMTTREDCSDRDYVLMALGMIGATAVVGLLPLIGMAYDWLAPVVVIATFGVVFPWRRALYFALVVWAVAAVTSVVIDRGMTTDQIALPAAFIFAFVFAVVIRYNFEQRQHAEQLITQLEEAQERLQAYANEVEELAVTRERNRMAREIHDTLGHYLTLLAVQLETATKLQERGDPRLRDELAEARRVAAECLAEVRRSVAALRPADPTAVSFTAALERLAAELEAVAPETEVVLDVEGPAQELPPELRLALYRCVQESLTNIRKHAQATKVLVRLRVDAAQAELVVLDNGVGAESSADGHEPGFGLLGMRERIALLGGTVGSTPESGRGWRVVVRIPLPADGRRQSLGESQATSVLAASSAEG